MNIIKFRQKRGYRLFNKPSNATKRDEYGLSQRQRCFEEFDKGTDWMVVAKEYGIKPTTCRRYYQTWRKLPKEFESVYRHMVLALKDPNVRSSAVSAFSHQLGLAPDEVEQILLRPWGLRSLLLARFGLKKIEVRYPESERLALIRMERAIRESGKSIQQVLIDNEMVAPLKNAVRKMAKEKTEGKAKR